MSLFSSIMYSIFVDFNKSSSQKKKKKKGQHRINTEPVPAEILENMRARDAPRSRDPTLPSLTDERRDHQNYKRTSEKHMETVRGDTGP